MSEDTTRPAGRFDTPTRAANPEKAKGVGEAETVRDRSSSDRVEERATSVFDPPRTRFEERAELGRGGMGRVTEAFDRALDRPVAIKHLLPSGTEGLVRFEREVRITARLQHPSIVPVLDAGRDADGQPFYIMRKIDGEPLSKRVAAATSVRDRIALVPAMLGAIDAAAYAHAQGVIHRDIKPWNILLGPFGETLLIDWGIARDLAETERMAAADPAAQRDSGLTRVGDAVGTPGFMAPEQARGESVDRRADVYSLGATLYFVLTGALPFAGSDATIAISLAAAGSGPDLSKIPPEVPAELSAIVIKALATDRAARYADASELAVDLRRFLAGQLVAAHHYTAGERFVRWIRKHRLAAAITLIAVVAIAATAIFAFRRVVDERDQARASRALAEGRAEELLVDRARALVQTDPTSAVAVLRGLPPGSKLWPIAREIVRAAIPAGIERALPTGSSSVYGLATAADGRVAMISTEGIQIHDPERRTRRVLPKLTGNQLHWRDARSLVCSFYNGSEPAKLFVIDVETGVVTDLPRTEIRQVAMQGGFLVVHNSDGTLDRYDGSLAPARIGKQGIVAIDTNRDRLLMVGRDAAIAVQADDTARVQDLALTRNPLTVRISPNGERFALLFPDELQEWQLGVSTPVRRWPRSGKVGQGIAYVGDTLYAWDNNGGGLVSLEGDVPVTRWQYRGETLPAPRFDHGFVLATTEGRIAIVDRLGATELPHRRIQLRDIDVAPDGRSLTLATQGGEVLTIDLRPVRPSLVAVPDGASLHGISGTKAVIGATDIDQYGSSGLTELSLLDLTTGATSPLGNAGFSPYVLMLDSLVVAGAGPRPGQSRNVRELIAWDLEGHERLRVPYTMYLQIDEGFRAGIVAVYGALDGSTVEQALEPLGPPLTIRAADDKMIARVNISREGIAFSTISKTETNKTSYEWIEKGPRKAPPIASDGYAMASGYSADGSWWIIEGVERVVRIAPDLTRTVVPLPQAISVLLLRGDKILAIGGTALYELDAQGTVQRTVSLPSTNRRRYLSDAVLSLFEDGIYVTAPEANVSRFLSLPGGANQHASTRDARMIAALTPTTPPYIAVWRDPVPVDPAAIRTYIEQLTNARLDLASTAVTWDRSAP